MVWDVIRSDKLFFCQTVYFFYLPKVFASYISHAKFQKTRFIWSGKNAEVCKITMKNCPTIVYMCYDLNRYPLLTTGNLWFANVFSGNRNRPVTLTRFSPMSHFYITWKRQKTIRFLTFSGGPEIWHWTKMG